MDDRCKTRYPILLLHGAGFRDLKRPLYWGRIPGALEAHGAALYYGQQDGWARLLRTPGSSKGGFWTSWRRPGPKR